MSASAERVVRVVANGPVVPFLLIAA